MHGKSRSLLFRALSRAVARRYNPEIEKASLVVAAGQGYLVEKILQRALGEEIPRELYRVIDDVLLLVHSIDKPNRRENHIKLGEF